MRKPLSDVPLAGFVPLIVKHLRNTTKVELTKDDIESTINNLSQRLGSNQSTSACIETVIYINYSRFEVELLRRLCQMQLSTSYSTSVPNEPLRFLYYISTFSSSFIPASEKRVQPKCILSLPEMQVVESGPAVSGKTKENCFQY